MWQKINVPSDIEVDFARNIGLAVSLCLSSRYSMNCIYYSMLVTVPGFAKKTLCGIAKKNTATVIGRRIL